MDRRANWLADWVRAGAREEQLRSPLVLTIFFGELVAPEIASVAARRLPRSASEAAVGTAPHGVCARGSRRLPVFTLRRGIAYQEMVVRWPDELRKFAEAA